MNLFFIVMILFTGFVLTAAPRSVSAENDVESGMTALPATHLFEPLRADPKEPRFFVSTLKIV
jgi:hypothetical protein